MNSSLPSSDFIPPRCEVYAVVGGRLHQPSILTQAFLIIIIVVNTVTFPLTAALNALVMIAVKKQPRLREHKSNITLALLASTDFVVGVIVQPVNVALMITVLTHDISGEKCALQVFTRTLSRVVVSASFFHMVLISGERYLAMRHSFAHFALLTETRLFVASVLGWLLAIILHINFAVNESVFMPINNTFYGLCLAFIIFCHVTVYREIRRHEKQIAAQQVTVEAREQFEKDKKAFKVTFIIIVVLVLCYFPILIFSAVLERFGSKISLEVRYICFFLSTLMAYLNSFFNPIIYSFRLREFRVAFIELICKTANIAEAEQREMKIFEHQTLWSELRQDKKTKDKLDKTWNNEIRKIMIVLIIAEPPRARRSPIAKKNDANGKGKFKRVLSFVFVDKRNLFVTKLSFEEFYLVFFTAEHLACFGPREPRHQSF